MIALVFYFEQVISFVKSHTIILVGLVLDNRYDRLLIHLLERNDLSISNKFPGE